jgi:hypothetical protein
LEDKEKKYGDLINQDAARRVLRGMFNDSVPGVVAELLQNAQRAGATRVEFATSGEGGSYAVSYRDDGHGLLGGMDGLHAFLKLAETFFENPDVYDQQPMGVGIYSLLAHPDIQSVVVRSGGLALEVDTQRWWVEPGYSKTWFDRVLESSAEADPGLRLNITCNASFAKALKDCLPPYRPQALEAEGRVREVLNFPAVGYEGILSVSLDGTPVYTGIPRRIRIPESILNFEFRGSMVRASWVDPEGGGATPSSVVNWYGQLIPIASKRLRRLQFFMDVKDGRPLNPLTPTRKGIVEDEAFTELLQELEDKLFAFVCDESNRHRIGPTVIAGLFTIDAARARRRCPYYLAARVDKAEPYPTSFESLTHTSDLVILSYDEVVTVVEPAVRVFDQATKKEISLTMKGLSTFAALEGAPEMVIPTRFADSKRLHKQAVWWVVDTAAANKAARFIVPPGFWAVGGVDEVPTNLKAVEGEVFALEVPAAREIRDAEWLCGTDDPVGFLQRWSNAAFEPAVEERLFEDELSDYSDSVKRLIRKVLGNRIPLNFTHGELQQFFPERQKTKISSVVFIHGNPGSSIPTEIAVYSSDGQEVRLTIME